MDELPSIEQETLLRELMEQFHKVAVTRYGSDSEQAQTSRRLLAAEARLIADTITLE